MLALVKDGFDPAGIRDPLYVDDPERRAFVPIDEAQHRRIVTEEMRL